MGLQLRWSSETSEPISWQEKEKKKKQAHGTDAVHMQK